MCRKYIKEYMRYHMDFHWVFFWSNIFQTDLLHSLLPLVSSLPCYVFCICQQIKIQMQISWVGRSTTHLLENSWDILIKSSISQRPLFLRPNVEQNPTFFASCTFSKFCVFHIPTVGLYQAQYCWCCCWDPCCWGGRWDNFGSNGNLEIWLFGVQI